MTMDGASYTKNYYTHSDLLNGPTINLEMSASPNYLRGIAAEDAPYSFSNELNKK
jgi:putative alpha-1,2-mannosidase